MMAADYRHIGGVEYRLGRHYSRFSPFSPTPALADQSLAWRKLWNAGSNRRSRVSSIHNPKIMLRMLVKVLSRDSITTSRGLSGERNVTFEDLVRAASAFDVRTVTVAGLISV